MGSNQDRVLLFFVCPFVYVCLRVCAYREKVSSRRRKRQKFYPKPNKISLKLALVENEYVVQLLDGAVFV
jgi:hypothetical protein